MSDGIELMDITVDGKTIDAEPGELLIAAAERAGVFVPRFCWHPRMEPVGACRMCLVDVEGSPPIPGSQQRRPQTSCTTVVREGMVVHTQFASEQIADAQRAILELLLINHPLDCPICDRGGECPLQDQTLDYGPSESRMVEPKRRFVKPVEISPLVKLDRERCILCYRCTRFCEEISGDTMISTMERGARAYIYPFPGDIFDSYFSGNTVQICPVGALTSAEYRFQARPWDLSLTTTTCNLCASGCRISADVRVSDGKLVRVSAGVNEDVNEEWLCDKGRYGHAYVSSTTRLTQPLARRGDSLDQVGWDEAFRILSERIGALTAQERATRTGIVVGGSLADEDLYVAQKFARLVLLTNSVDHRLEGGPTAGTLLPPLTYQDLLGADLVCLVSADLREELPLVFLRLRVAAEKGRVKLAIVHPRRVALTELASAHLAPLPRTEALVGAGIAAALGHPVAAGAEVLGAGAGVTSADLRGLAELLRDAERPVVLLGPGVTDPEAIHAWTAAADLTGARVGWAGRRAGERGALAAGAHPELLPGWRLVEVPADRSEIGASWGTELPAAPGRDVGAMLNAAAEGATELLWLIGADVIGDVPDHRLGAAALERARFVVVQDVQEGPQLAHADLVLPAAAFAERSGTLTNWEGRRQPINAAVDPPGAARGDYAILSEAARRLGSQIGCRTIEDARAELDGLLASARPPVRTTSGTVRVTQPETDHAHPLRLLTQRLLYDAGSRASHTDGIRDQTKEAFVELHPDDARAAGVEDGADVRVSSRHGSVTVKATVSDAVRRGVAFLPYAQPGASSRDLLAWTDRAPGVRVEPAT